MFEGNDKPLATTRKVVVAFWIIAAIAWLVVGILLAIRDILIGLIVLVAGVLLLGLFWILWDLLFSFLCDIKLIRNKLYDTDNARLERTYDNTDNALITLYNLREKKELTEEEFLFFREALVKKKNKDIEEEIRNAALSYKIKEFVKLKKLFKQGAITEEVFESAKEKYLNGERGV